MVLLTMVMIDPDLKKAFFENAANEPYSTMAPKRQVVAKQNFKAF
jgi:hypothetical protein